MIREIIASEYLDEAQGLMLEHWQEVAEETGVPKPCIDREYLESMEAAGQMFCLGVFDGTELVGYSLNSIGSTLNFDTLVIMDNEGIFIKKPYRGSIGKLLILESERIGKARGAVRCKWHTYKDSRADRIFAALGYAAYDVIYTKEL